MILLILLVFVAAAWILTNAAQTSEHSHETSNMLSELIMPLMHTGADYKDKNMANLIVRKTAHIAEYFWLSLFVSGLVSVVSDKRPVLLAVIPAVFVLALAVGDEYIQSFWGRSSSWTDVLIDMIGAAIGIGTVFLIRAVKNKKN